MNVATRIARRLCPGVLVSLTMLAALTGCAGGGDTRSSPTATVETPSPSAETRTPLPPATRLSIDRAATFYGRDAGDNASGMVAGDFNGDGALDILLAASQADGPGNGRADGGEVYLFLGPFQPADERDAAQGQEALTVYGADAGDQLGRAMTAGDFNGDGFDDMVLAAPSADGSDKSRPDAGEVYVLFGSPQLGRAAHEIDLATATSDVTIYGIDAGDLAGFALQEADVNGDHVSDLVIGAFPAAGPDNSRPGAGEVYVVTGAANLLAVLDLAAGAQAATVYGAEAGDRLGEAIAAGDVNGDGTDDLILPATFAAGPDNARRAAGETYVILGPPPARTDIAEGGPALTVIGADAGDQLGHSLGSGDVNGDGRDDLLLAAVSSNGLDNKARLAGEAAVVLAGGESGRQVDVAAGGAASLIYGDAGDRLGRSAAVGRINGDALADLLLGAPGDDGAKEDHLNAGAIFIIFGSPSLPAVMPLPEGGGDLVLEGKDPGDVLGTEVFATPSLLTRDMDGDGRDELLVSAPDGDGPDNRRADSGEGYIVFLDGALGR